MQACPPCPTISGLALWLPIIVNIVLAGIVLWYTLETRKQRKQNQAQLNLLKQQARQSIAPFVLPTATNLHSMLSDMRDSEESVAVKETYEKNIRKRFEKSGVKYIAHAANLTDNLAVNIQVYLFEHVPQVFFKASEGRSFLSKNLTPSWNDDAFEVTDKPFAETVLKDDLRRLYAANHEILFKHLTADKSGSFIAVLYTDAEGNPYLVRRGFELNLMSVLISRGGPVRYPS